MIDLKIKKKNCIFEWAKEQQKNIVLDEVWRFEHSLN